MKLARLLLSLGLFGVLGCGSEDPTQIVVDNDYPPVPDGGNPATEMTVFKVWWVTSLLPDPVAPASEGQTERTVPNADFAYAVLAPGWDPSSTTPPSTLIVAKSVVKLNASRGDTLHVRVSDGTFVGRCAASQPLSADDAKFITQSIFPGEFAGVTYDAATCTTSRASAADGAATSVEASADGGWNGPAMDGE